MDRNLQLVLAKRPLDRVDEDCFAAVESDVPELESGQILVKTCWLAFAPAQRGYLNDLPSYAAPVGLGDVMRATGAGQVVASQHPEYAPGDLVTGLLGWQKYALLTPGGPDSGVEKLDAGVDPKVALNALGTTGLTAYIGMHDLGRPNAGSTVLVTAAAGATGSIAGQIARAMGARTVIGTASTPEKRAWVCDVAGFDGCVDYRDRGRFRQLRAAAPDGFDVVFDNVGGELLDDALANIAVGARVVLCGAISTGYRPERPAVGLRNYQFLTTRRASMQGFIVLDHRARYAEARRDLLKWIEAGAIHWAEDITEGLAKAPATLQRLFDGENLGKQLLHVADPEDN